ncbi:indole-3-acetic acid-induced protein ARG7-like protein [Carex littledalei]|uniref:Indole-3-acetic acid-induced protein ARG7-like protein n=1 Tax=Carex littledalei TaxID=544730 RepID=A0A833QK58_9POAL|nr:indole-3-acetic acid-induced protein ARG7-like protein [Carex littledalei]
MENPNSSSNKKEKKGLFAKAIERCRSISSGLSGDTKNQSKSRSNPSSPRQASPRIGFWNRSKSNSCSCHGSTQQTEKKNLTKTLQRSWSLSSWYRHMKTQSKFNPTSPSPSFLRRSESNGRASSSRVVPAGCLTVCVGPKKQRFVVKMACLNHTLFHALLQQAENEFGFTSDGPVMLPCDVETFQQVMMEMEQRRSPENSPRCNFSRSPYRYGLISPSTSVVAGPI